MQCAFARTVRGLDDVECGLPMSNTAHYTSYFQVMWVACEF